LIPALANLPPFNAPCLAVGIILLIYWARVARMAWKMRRKTGRAANFIPIEPLGKALRLLWQPVVIAWIILPLAASFISVPRVAFVPLIFCSILQWIGVAIALFCFLATRSCWRRMGKSWRMGIDPNEKTELISTGPYAYVRHPIYSLSSLMMIATVMVLSSPVMIGIAVVHIALLQWEARREERNLSRIHGPQYDQYCSRVGRFLPISFGK
jgi:protein-S-isoprenylcysteine O-methyltransferase Ste14